MSEAILRELFGALDKRQRPEEVADLIVKLDEATGETRNRTVLNKAARQGHRWRGSWSSMTEDFERVDPADSQVAAVARLIGVDGTKIDVLNARQVRAFAERSGAHMEWSPVATDYKKDRLNRTERKARGIDVPKRQYNRRFRALSRLAHKAKSIERSSELRRLQLVGRTGFAVDIPWGMFKADPQAARFVGYYAARRNVRRGFSLHGRENPFDEIASALLSRLDGGSDWRMVAQVHPVPAILERLTDADRGQLLGRWYTVMRDAASMLKGLWGDDRIDRQTMVVRRGMDSSTWNTVAQAYNAARAGWLNCLASVGALAMLDAACPPKVMRLMAADLFRWHQMSGGDVHPDTIAAAELPLAWEVLDGRTVCTRSDVEEACFTAKLDPVSSGWLAPRATSAIAEFKATPELVHGVSVADPAWASLLRRAGVFSGHGGRKFKGLDVDVPTDVVVSDLPEWGRWPRVPNGD